VYLKVRIFTFNNTCFPKVRFDSK